MRFQTILILLCFFLSSNIIFAAEVINKQGEAKSVSTDSSKRKPAREPFEIAPEFRIQKEEIEPPELRVTGIVQVSGGAASAVVELNLDDFEGTVILEPGMRVSMPRPNRENLSPEKWMTYFTVQRVSRAGIRIELENGEVVWFPVMGEKDYD